MAEIHRKLAPADEWPEDSTVAVQYGAVADVTDQTSIHEAMHATHDILVKITGGLRSSGVQWRIVNATDTATWRACLTTGELDPRSAPGATAALIEYLTANPAGALILASCTVTQAATKVGLS